MDKHNKKSLSVTLEKAAESPVVYDYFLLKTSEAGLEVDLAQKRETKDKIELIVKQSFAISADKMLEFCLDVFQTLQKYEETYNNGKGIPPIRDVEEDS